MSRYKISKESVDKFFKPIDVLKVEDIVALGWESPIKTITEQIYKETARRLDETVYEAVLNTNVIVDKDELVKALQYDREQYDKGYKNGYKACFDNLPKWAKDLIIWSRENEQRKAD
jgi:hypothetical protein